jgi:hypothetical protein
MHSTHVVRNDKDLKVYESLPFFVIVTKERSCCAWKLSSYVSMDLKTRIYFKPVKHEDWVEVYIRVISNDI